MFFYVIRLISLLIRYYQRVSQTLLCNYSGNSTGLLNTEKFSITVSQRTLLKICLKKKVFWKAVKFYPYISNNDMDKPQVSVQKDGSSPFFPQNFCSCSNIFQINQASECLYVLNVKKQFIYKVTAEFYPVPGFCYLHVFTELKLVFR